MQYFSDSRMEQVISKMPCRRTQIEKLYNLFVFKDEPYVDIIYIHGGPSTGKSMLLNHMLTKLRVKHCFINLLECYSQRILFETILNEWTGHRLNSQNLQPYAKCDNLMDFIAYFRDVEEDEMLLEVVLVLDKAEELLNMDSNLLRAFLRLKELTEYPITVVFISQLVYEKFNGKNDDIPVVKVHFPQYTKEELLEIMTLDYEDSKDLLLESYSETFTYDRPFFKNYLNALLSVFYRACRDVEELRRAAQQNFLKYCEPIIKKECTVNDAMVLWRKSVPKLKSSLDVLYLRVDSEDHNDANTFSFTINKNVQSLELPFYAKYLLIAAYLASYNSAKDDKRLFMKNHGKKVRSVKGVKRSDRLNTQLGPQLFSLDRLLAIFYSILDNKVGFNNNLLVQVSSLVELKLLSTTDSCNLDGQKYKCNVSYDFIHSIAAMVGFNIRKYLSDFNL